MKTKLFSLVLTMCVLGVIIGCNKAPTGPVSPDPAGSIVTVDGSWNDGRPVVSSSAATINGGGSSIPLYCGPDGSFVVIAGPISGGYLVQLCSGNFAGQTIFISTQFFEMSTRCGWWGGWYQQSEGIN